MALVGTCTVPGRAGSRKGTTAGRARQQSQWVCSAPSGKASAGGSSEGCLFVQVAAIKFPLQGLQLQRADLQVVASGRSQRHRPRWLWKAALGHGALHGWSRHSGAAILRIDPPGWGRLFRLSRWRGRAGEWGTLYSAVSSRSTLTPGAPSPGADPGTCASGVRRWLHPNGMSSDIRFWSSGDTKTGPPDGLLMGA